MIDSDARELTEYRDLLLAYEPHPVRSEEEAEAYLDVIDALTDLRRMSKGQHVFLGLLSQLVYDWEQEHEPPIEVAPRDVVRYLLESRGLRQADLIGPVFATRSGVSDFLSGRRPLSYERVQRLARFFRVSPALFFADEGADTRG
jgi:HTH-type transcriptional regulator/antitoxin HigA